jgi:predicted metal-dependent phosphoesterase TrpH
MSFCDLHLHTRYSDGIHEPAEVVRMCKEAGLIAGAITDHDTVEGVGEAEDAGRRLGIEIVPGVELSAEEGNLEVHLLGYFVDCSDSGLKRKLVLFQEERKRRAERILEKLRDAGVHIEIESVLRAAEHGTVGRPHIAEALMNHGYVGSVREAFERFIGKEGPYYVPKYKMTPKEAIRLISEHGGVPVYAHPGVNGALRNETLEDLIRAGLAGIEVWHPEHSQEQTKEFIELADRYGLVKTGGTDFHGENISSTPIGSVKVPSSSLRELRKLVNR